MSVDAPVAVIGGGAFGGELQARLAHALDFIPDESIALSTIRQLEIACAGARTFVVLAGAAPSTRRGAAPYREHLADTVARVASAVGATRLIAVTEEDNDPRLPLLDASGVPLTLLRPPYADLPQALEGLLRAPLPMSTSFTPALPEEIPSAQRLSTSASARDLAEDYFRWLGSSVLGVRVSRRGERVGIKYLGVEVLVLREARGEIDDDSCPYQLVGGKLVEGVSGPEKSLGRFEFRRRLDGSGAYVALVGFRPSYPNFLYRWTQARMHERVMRRFAARETISSALRSG